MPTQHHSVRMKLNCCPPLPGLLLLCCPASVYGSTQAQNHRDVFGVGFSLHSFSSAMCHKSVLSVLRPSARALLRPPLPLAWTAVNLLPFLCTPVSLHSDLFSSLLPDESSGGTALLCYSSCYKLSMAPTCPLKKAQAPWAGNHVL